MMIEQHSQYGNYETNKLNSDFKYSGKESLRHTDNSVLESSTPMVPANKYGGTLSVTKTNSI